MMNISQEMKIFPQGRFFITIDKILYSLIHSRSKMNKSSKRMRFLILRDRCDICIRDVFLNSDPLQWRLTKHDSF